MIERTEILLSDLKRFERLMGYTCNIDNPKTHAEKVMRKKYVDRNPLLTLTADKIKVEEYIQEKLGNKDILLPRFTSYRVDEAMTEIEKRVSAHQRIAVKSNRGSGMNLFIIDKPDLSFVRGCLENWQSSEYGESKGEWCYEDIKPGFLIEPLVFSGPHIIYRFLCFDGICKYIHAHEYNFKTKNAPGLIAPYAEMCSTYSEGWEFEIVSYKNYPFRKMSPPASFMKMKKIAEKLSAPFDYCRADLFEHGITKQNIGFSEITHYPVSGKCKFDPVSFDHKLGECWS